MYLCTKCIVTFVMFLRERAGQASGLLSPCHVHYYVQRPQSPDNCVASAAQRRQHCYVCSEDDLRRFSFLSVHLIRRRKEGTALAHVALALCTRTTYYCMLHTTIPDCNVTHTMPTTIVGQKEEQDEEEEARGKQQSASFLGLDGVGRGPGGCPHFHFPRHALIKWKKKPSSLAPLALPLTPRISGEKAFVLRCAMAAAAMLYVYYLRTCLHILLKDARMSSVKGTGPEKWNDKP